VTIKVTRPIVIAGAVICGIAVVFLSSVVVLNWKDSDFREKAFSLVLLFDLIFAYRFYRYLKMLSDPSKYGILPF
jgi:hypothetical protein